MMKILVSLTLISLFSGLALARELSPSEKAKIKARANSAFDELDNSKNDEIPPVPPTETTCEWHRYSRATF